ncbi:CHAP domain-containing protein [Streptosporangium sp. NPDC002524]|uniref:CHAP domain-containing protein n=1 Tax=Streptosporangium sp. NPDC002524 TaxID=3154537 RepID=UPI003330D5FF
MHKFIELLESQLGYSEKSGGYTKFGDWYGKNVEFDADYTAAPWCDMYLSWAAEKLGYQEWVGQFAYTVHHAQWFRQQDAWGTVPKPGAVVFFDWSGSNRIDHIDHVGIVTGVEGGRIHTIEGNIDGGIAKRKERDTGKVVGYGYPEKIKARLDREATEKQTVVKPAAAGDNAVVIGPGPDLFALLPSPAPARETRTSTSPGKAKPAPKHAAGTTSSDGTGKTVSGNDSGTASGQNPAANAPRSDRATAGAPAGPQASASTGRTSSGSSSGKPVKTDKTDKQARADKPGKHAKASTADTSALAITPTATVRDLATPVPGLDSPAVLAPVLLAAVAILAHGKARQSKVRLLAPTPGRASTPSRTSGRTPAPSRTSGRTPAPSRTSGHTPAPSRTSGHTTPSPSPAPASGHTTPSPSPALTSGRTPLSPSPALASGRTPLSSSPALTSGSPAPSLAFPSRRTPGRRRAPGRRRMPRNAPARALSYSPAPASAPENPPIRDLSHASTPADTLGNTPVSRDLAETSTLIHGPGSTPVSRLMEGSALPHGPGNITTHDHSYVPASAGLPGNTSASPDLGNAPRTPEVTNMFAVTPGSGFRDLGDVPVQPRRSMTPQELVPASTGFPSVTTSVAHVEESRVPDRRDDRPRAPYQGRRRLREQAVVESSTWVRNAPPRGRRHRQADSATTTVPAFPATPARPVRPTRPTAPTRSAASPRSATSARPFAKPRTAVPISTTARTGQGDPALPAGSAASPAEPGDVLVHSGYRGRRRAEALV